jgi:pimeloyl-ACP methyl ester carboxylesterase
MITFILPGYSLKNKEWLEECAMSLKVEGTIRPVFWEHWNDPDEKFKPKEKASLIARHAKGDKVNIIAKSIGSLVAAYIIEQIPDQINKVIICGIPLTDLKEGEDIIKVLETLDPAKIICFQNEFDPHGSFTEVRAFLPEKIKVVSKERSDHHYPYYTEFNEFLKD